MRPGVIAVVALIAGAAINSAQAAPKESQESSAKYRWCVMYGADTGDGQRHCYFHRLSECRKAITGADGVCVPNEIRAGASVMMGGAGQ